MAQAKWVHAVNEEQRDIARCSLVRRVPAGSAAFLTGTVAKTTAAAAYDATPLLPVIAFYRDHFGVQPTLRTRDCGEINAYYSVTTDTVTLCSELLDAEPPAIVRFVLAHELAHATMRQLSIQNDETSADELGALVELELDPGDVWATASWILSNEEPTKGDSHPGNLSRAQMMVCLADGAEEHPASWQCEVYYKRAVQLWTRILVLGHKLQTETDGGR